MSVLHSLVDIKLILIYRQQAPPSLPFAHPKEKLSDGLGVAAMLSYFKSTHAFKQELSFGLE